MPESRQDRRPREIDESRTCAKLARLGRRRVSEWLSCPSARLCEDRLKMKRVTVDGLSGVV